MGNCCPGRAAPPPIVDDDARTPYKSNKHEKREQKARLHTGASSDDVFDEKDAQLRMMKKKGVRRGAVDDDDDEGGLTPVPDISSLEHRCEMQAGGAEAEAAAAAEAEATAAAAEREAAAAAAAQAQAEARAAAEEASRKAEAEHAAKLNSALAARVTSSKPNSNAAKLHTAAALALTDGAAFDAFIRWEDSVQATAHALLGSKLPALSRKPKRRGGGGASEGNLFTLLALEEQTRNSCFVSALQTQTLSRPLQSKALRCVHWQHARSPQSTSTSLPLHSHHCDTHFSCLSLVPVRLLADMCAGRTGCFATTCSTSSRVDCRPSRPRQRGSSQRTFPQ